MLVGAAASALNIPSGDFNLVSEGSQALAKVMLAVFNDEENRSVTRILSILELITAHPEGLTLGQI